MIKIRIDYSPGMVNTFFYGGEKEKQQGQVKSDVTDRKHERK